MGSVVIVALETSFLLKWFLMLSTTPLAKLEVLNLELALISIL